MIKNAVGKVMWVGRATVFLVGLAVVLALVLGLASAALGTTGGNFILGKANGATTVSKLTANIAGPALNLVNNSTAAAATALNITVTSGKAPLKVNAAAGKATNLNSDKLDGKDSRQFLGANGKAADANTLDGLDSTALGITTEHNFVSSRDCDDPTILNRCAKVQVVVPPGKQYLVSVWSTMSWKGGASEQTISYCSARDADCITPFGPRNYVTVPAGKIVSASSEGETLPLSEGTYTFNTMVDTEAEVSGDLVNRAVVITKVMVRDASAPQPTGVSLVP